MADPQSQPQSGIKFSRIKRVHPRLNLDRVRMLHAMYRGGDHLLGDNTVMDWVFGKIGDESDLIYNERKRRAFYENLFAMVVNQISAGLAQDPCRLSQNTDGKPDDAPSVDDYWPDLMKNASVQDEDGSEERSYDQMMRDGCVEALVCGWSWFQCDLPSPSAVPDEETAISLNDQETAGDLRAYVLTWPTDAITDWEEKAGRLLWVRTYECIAQSLTPDAPRWPDRGGVRTHRWTVWVDDTWTRYEIQESLDEPLSKWTDEMVVPVASSGPHSFGRVPWIRFDLCTPGTYLHVGDLIESLCRVYFNRTNGESWQWTQNCFQQLYEFLAPEMAGIDTPISNAQQDPGRARRRRAPGVVHERGENDKAMFVAPNMSGADIGKQATQDLRDAVLRVTAQMALAQDTSGAMLGRSADSKKQDTVAQEIVMGAIGKRLIIAANQVAKLLAQGRADKPEDAPQLEGYARFDVDDATTLITDTVALDVVSIPSATYQVEAKFRVAAAHLGDNVDPAVLKKIRTELEGAITQDQLEEALIPPEPPQFPGQEDPEADNPDTPPTKSPFTPKPAPTDGNGFPKKQPKKPFGKSDAGPQKTEPAPGHQEKPWSCGPAALVNVMWALGKEVSEKRVRELSDADKDGTDEHQLLAAADALGLTAEVLHSADGDDMWDELISSVSDGRPCVLCVDSWDHWVAVVGVSGDRVVMQDSANTEDNIEANGVHLMTKAQLTKRWKCKGVSKSFYAISFEKKADAES